MGLSGNNSHKKNCIACSCSMCLESGSLVRNRGIEKNEWVLGTVVLTHLQRVNVWCTSAREGDGRREGGPLTSRAQNPLFLLFQRADKIGSVSQLYLLTVLPILGKRVTFFFYLPHFLFSTSLVIILTPTLTVMILISVQLKMWVVFVSYLGLSGLTS